MRTKKGGRGKSTEGHSERASNNTGRVQYVCPSGNKPENARVTGIKGQREISALGWIQSLQIPCPLHARLFLRLRPTQP